MTLPVRTPPTGTQAIDRAAQLLILLVEDDGGRTLTDLVEATGLPKSTASRLLRALERNGLARRAPSGAYRPGPVLDRYARRGGAAVDLIALAQEHLDRLGSATGETINLGLPDPLGFEVVAQVDSRYLLGGTNWIGMRGHAHASALGKVFLAHGVLPVPSGRLERVAPRTVTNVVSLLEDLERVRRSGYATTCEELEPGLLAVAAPVRDAGGVVVAALSISAPTFRIAADELDRLGALVAEEAGRLSARLGHTTPKEGAA